MHCGRAYACCPGLRPAAAVSHPGPPPPCARVRTCESSVCSSGATVVLGGWMAGLWGAWHNRADCAAPQLLRRGLVRVRVQAVVERAACCAAPGAAAAPAAFHHRRLALPALHCKLPGLPSLAAEPRLHRKHQIISAQRRGLARAPQQPSSNRQSALGALAECGAATPPPRAATGRPASCSGHPGAASPAKWPPGGHRAALSASGWRRGALRPRRRCSVHAPLHAPLHVAPCAPRSCAAAAAPRQLWQRQRCHAVRQLPNIPPPGGGGRCRRLAQRARCRSARPSSTRARTPRAPLRASS